MFLMFHVLQGWKITALDISDAYLTVPQVEVCYVEMRGWIKELLGLPAIALWKLKRVLPGQRNGAQRWFNSFADKLQSIGFEQCMAIPSVFRHKTKRILVNMHVDDELVASETAGDAHWLISELKKTYKLQVEGPFPEGLLGDGEEINYLKKSYVFQVGIFIKPICSSCMTWVPGRSNVCPNILC